MLDGNDALRAEVRSPRKELGERDAIIEDLQTEVKELRLANDALAQCGGPVVDLANTVLQLDPPLQLDVSRWLLHNELRGRLWAVVRGLYLHQKF